MSEPSQVAMGAARIILNLCRATAPSTEQRAYEVRLAAKQIDKCMKDEREQHQEAYNAACKKDDENAELQRMLARKEREFDHRCIEGRAQVRRLVDSNRELRYEHTKFRKLLRDVLLHAPVPRGGSYAERQEDFRWFGVRNRIENALQCKVVVPAKGPVKLARYVSDPETGQLVPVDRMEDSSDG